MWGTGTPQGTPTRTDWHLLLRKVTEEGETFTSTGSAGELLTWLLKPAWQHPAAAAARPRTSIADVLCRAWRPESQGGRTSEKAQTDRQCSLQAGTAPTATADQLRPKGMPELLVGLAPKSSAPGACCRSRSEQTTRTSHKRDREQIHLFEAKIPSAQKQFDVLYSRLKPGDKSPRKQN